MTKTGKALLTVWIVVGVACGLSVLDAEEVRPEPRLLLGGTPAPAVEFPHVVGVSSIVPRKQCLGVLLTRQWVLTAAHCVDGLSSVTVTHIAGERAFDSFGDDSRYYALRHIHPDWDPLAGEYESTDLALVRLEDPLTSAYVRPVRLLTEEEADTLQPGAMATLVGLDVIGSTTGVSYVETPLLNSENGRLHFGAASQPGDSGGAVMIRRNDEWAVIGVIYWVNESEASVVAQSVHTNRQWIGSHIPELGIPAAPTPVTPPATTRTGVTVSVSGPAGTTCVAEDLVTRRKGTTLAYEGTRLRTVVLVEYGTP